MDRSFTTSGSSARPADPPPLPPGIRRALLGFRSAMRRRKVAEALALALLAALVSFLVFAAADRLVVVAPFARAALLAVAVLVAAVAIPRTLRRWVLRHRHLEEVAVEISRRDPIAGDRLLGVFELSHDRGEFARSPALVRAAIARGERDLGDGDLDHALPRSRHRLLGRLLVLPAVGTLAFAVSFPEVAANAFSRWTLPFAAIERFTFTRIDGPDAEWVVPVQEVREVVLRLADGTRWRPARASLRVVGGGAAGRVEAALDGDVYRLLVPPLDRPRAARLVVGDLRASVDLVPRERPEVLAASARVTLPGYLDLDVPRVRDVRGGSLAVVAGSEVAVELELSRELGSATIEVPRGDGEGGPTRAVAAVRGARVSGPPLRPAGALDAAFTWTDVLGLEGHAPFRLSVRSDADEPPEVMTSGAEREVVLLDSVALTFDVLAADDFGVRRTGLEWFVPSPVELEAPRSLGDKVLLSSAPDAERVEALATFRPRDLGVPPGPVDLRAWAVDALPGRSRTYSRPIRVEVMTSEQHLEWVGSRFDRWMQRATEVRDRELELYAENEALFALGEDELAEPGARRRLEAQAAAERANRAQLRALVGEASELIGQAARNPDADPEELDEWAEANAKLQRIAEEEMETVAKLLTKAARGEASADAPGVEASMAGRILAAGASPAPDGGEDGSEESSADGEEPVMPPTPTILDVESTVAESDAPAAAEPETSEAAAGDQGPAPLGLAGTTVGPAGSVAAGEEAPADDGEREAPRSLTKEDLAKAIEAQKELIAEFNDVAGEIQRVLVALEGSTFVKRLKAASRAQTESAESLAVPVARGFGSTVASVRDDVAQATEAVVRREGEQSRSLGDLYGDLDAYTDRLTFRDSDEAPRFQRVLRQWNETRPVFVAEDLALHAGSGRPGEARMAASYLADTLDRWGDELVGPTEEEPPEEGEGNAASLPPAIVLEVLKITESEMELRDMTREVEQARSALEEAEADARARPLADEQNDLALRLETLMNDIRKLPDGSRKFGSEMRMLATARRAMVEAFDLLIVSDTGRETIAAETEAIELLLQSRRAAGGGGGGGGGASPGGGGGGTDGASALALAGRSTGEGEAERERDVDRATARTLSKIPVEFQEALERYFEALEGER